MNLFKAQSDIIILRQLLLDWQGLVSGQPGIAPMSVSKDSSRIGENVSFFRQTTLRVATDPRQQPEQLAPVCSPLWITLWIPSYTHPSGSHWNPGCSPLWVTLWIPSYTHPSGSHWNPGCSPLWITLWTPSYTHPSGSHWNPGCSPLWITLQTPPPCVLPLAPSVDSPECPPPPPNSPLQCEKPLSPVCSRLLQSVGVSQNSHLLQQIGLISSASLCDSNCGDGRFGSVGSEWIDLHLLGSWICCAVRTVITNGHCGESMERGIFNPMMDQTVFQHG